MSTILETGSTVQTASSNRACKVGPFLGGGTQGEVYQARLMGNTLALKWYHPDYLRQDGRLKERLERAISAGPPTDRFLWPMELAVSNTISGFGYIMPLREPRFISIVDRMKGHADPSFQTLATAGFELARSYFQLHSKGLCYRDISFNNVFFDPRIGEVRICDNDNVDINRTPGAIAGSPDFMAPEIVLNTEPPSTQSDIFSLAVLLFYMFFLSHPLLGKKLLSIHVWNLQARRKLLGSEPVFIFDPENSSNPPVPEDQDPLREAGANAIAYWEVYPKFFRELFIKAFTKGITDPQHGRVRETEWQAAMIKLRDSIIFCPKCGKQNFYDQEKYNPTSNISGACWKDKSPLQVPPRIRLGHLVVMLNLGTKLFPYHTDDPNIFDFSQPTAEVIAHPTKPGAYGLRNISQDKWVIVLPDGSLKDIDPGKSTTLQSGLKVLFGKQEGQIRC